MEESGLGCDPDCIFSYSPSYEEGIAAGKAIAASALKITGLVTTADICAIGIMEGARLGGLRIPTDLSVIGYDNLAVSTYTTPKLTTISQNVIKKQKQPWNCCWRNSAPDMWNSRTFSWMWSWWSGSLRCRCCNA